MEKYRSKTVHVTKSHTYKGPPCGRLMGEVMLLVRNIFLNLKKTATGECAQLRLSCRFLFIVFISNRLVFTPQT